MARTDGRKPTDLRELSIVYERLDRVDGAAKFGFGETKSLASVSGPIEVRANLELPSQATLDIHIRPLASISGTDSKALSTTLKGILSPALLLSHHPRTLVQIVGQALCGTGSGSGMGSVGRGWNASLVASVVNASSAALVNASSVPMRGVVCAVAVGRIPSESGLELVLDPSEAEISRLSGGGCFAFLFSAVLPSGTRDAPSGSLLWTNYTTNTPFDEAELKRARELAEGGAREVWKTLKESVGTMDASHATTVRKTKAEPEVMEENASYAEDSDDAKMEI
ncbi:ribosomal protein S5 domain 2-type protein [Fomitopsis serialis]|uniref:ribosomal protein S5 domain 2-type protein n=1 Tax=Fomitopsis serialis TaxID=139415 RepID=UPI0020085DA5|nr:ribosomal protein S5 domain 2-type protein [Neoantrodia serialis]KAH9933004.1 ribosomal protein S5 domain 2-type protein [Neoantrodia serialis]